MMPKYLATIPYKKQHKTFISFDIQLLLMTLSAKSKQAARTTISNAATEKYYNRNRQNKTI